MTRFRSKRLTPSQRLRVLLGASVCLHAGLLWPLMQPHSFASTRETLLSVHLVSAEPATAAAPATARVEPPSPPPRRAPSPPPTASTSAPLPRPAPAREPVDASPTAADADGDSRDMSRDAAVAAIQSLVLSDLRRYFDYPSVARRYGWQGTVWLAFTVEANGAVDRIHVANSSGYDVLDRSAVVAMRRVGRLPETSGWLGGRALEMRVPIIYRLIDQ